jgi:hypothetical protein
MMAAACYVVSAAAPAPLRERAFMLQFFRSHFTVGSKAAFIALPTFGVFW